MIFYSLGYIHGFVLEASGDLGKIKPDEAKLLCLSVFFPESTRLSLCSQSGETCLWLALPSGSGTCPFTIRVKAFCCLLPPGLREFHVALLSEPHLHSAWLGPYLTHDVEGFLSELLRNGPREQRESFWDLSWFLQNQPEAANGGNRWGLCVKLGSPTVKNKALVLFSRNRSLEDWGNRSVTEHLPGVVVDSILNNLSSPSPQKSQQKNHRLWLKTIRVDLVSEFAGSVRVSRQFNASYKYSVYSGGLPLFQPHTGCSARETILSWL